MWSYSRVNGNSGSVLTIGTEGSSDTSPIYVELDGLTLTGGAGIYNRFGGGGGGLFVASGATATLDHVTVTGNSGSPFQSNPADGGGIFNEGVTHVTDCTVINNRTGGSGGGIYNYGDLVVDNSTITGNTAGPNGTYYDFTPSGGGGIDNVGQLVIENSTIANNVAGGRGGSGGGIANDGVSNTNTMVAFNCTVSGNTATENGGGIFSGGTATLTNLTITNNRTVPEYSGAGGGVYTYGLTSPSAPSAVAANTIISGNFAGTDALALVDDLAGTLTASSSHNLIGGNARLGPLADNGGPTLTCAPQYGSPVVDAGSNAQAVDENGNPLTTDQRGDPRIFGGGVDIGAVESQVPAPPSPDQLVLAGAGPGSPPRVNVYNPHGQLEASFLAFAPTFTGGVRVATLDANSDGVADIIVAAGPGGGPAVKVFDGTKLGLLQADGELEPSAVITSLYAYAPTFTGGVNIAAEDGYLVTGAGPGGGPDVKVYTIARDYFGGTGEGYAASQEISFYAYNSSFHGGVTVAIGNVNGDGTPDVITGVGPGGGPHVKVFDGAGLAAGGPTAVNAITNPLKSFYAFSPTFTAGVTVAVGDVAGAGTDDIVTGAGAGGGPHVKAFDYATLNTVASFYAYAPTFTGGVNVATAPYNGDTTSDIVAGSGPGGSQVQVFGQEGQTTEANFTPFDPSFLGGVFVG